MRTNPMDPVDFPTSNAAYPGKSRCMVLQVVVSYDIDNLSHFCVTSKRTESVLQKSHLISDPPTSKFVEE
jgi:hypothetical protein